jgi:uncharacterized membrane protein YfcA
MVDAPNSKTVRCGDCRSLLSPTSDANPRQPCPVCGSLRRHLSVVVYEPLGAVSEAMTAVSAAIDWMEWETKVDWRWLALFVGITAVGPILGWEYGWLPGAAAAAVSTPATLLGIPLGLMAIWRQRTIKRS